MSDHIVQQSLDDCSPTTWRIDCTLCREGFHTHDGPLGRALMHQFRNQHKHTRGMK